MNIEDFCNRVSNMAIKSILYEVAATPKPGLVDRRNSGAHNDMDFFTFLSSASVLGPYFYDCSKFGIEFQNKDYRKLLKKLRPIGIKAENQMFEVTKNINTHKGVIFSLGIISAAIATLYKEEKRISYKVVDISNRVKSMAQGISNELQTAHNKEKTTYGEGLYIEYGIKGIRGEVESGFETVLKYSYPMFSQLIKEDKHSINSVLVHSLIHLLAYTEDSNILGRHNMDTLIYAQKKAKEAMELGGYLSNKGRDFIMDMDKDFIKKNISPGGSADLLAVTLMLYFIENGDVL